MADVYQFRLANEGDLEQLYTWTRALMDHEAIEKSLELPLKPDVDEKLKEWISALIANDSALFIIAEDESGQAYGCVLGLIQLAPNDFIDMTMHGIIQMVWVEPETRRTGLAAQLVEHMESTFKNLQIPYCEISYSITNDEARGFWQSVGYAPISQTCRKFLN